jgi:hypothetical protein
LPVFGYVAVRKNHFLILFKAIDIIGLLGFFCLAVGFGRQKGCKPKGFKRF